MIITTTNHVEKQAIEKHLGVVSGHAIMGANFLKDALARMRDAVGGRSTSYERVMRNAEEAALKELADEATRLGANAVVGVRINHAPIHASGNLLMAVAYGTAVRVGEASK